MLPTNNSYYSSTSYPHCSSHRRQLVQDDQRGKGGETPPLRNATGGASAARSSGPRPLPSPTTPELAPHPWDPIQVPATNAAAPLFLPPTLSFIDPALYLLASIFVLLTPARNPTSLLNTPLPLPPTETTTPPTTAESKPRGTHRRRTSGRGPPSPRRRRPHHPGRRGGGAQDSAPCHSRDRAAARLGTSARSSFVVVIVVGGSAGGERPRRRLPDAEAATEEAAAAVILTYFDVGCGRMFCVFGLVAVRCVCW